MSSEAEREDDNGRRWGSWRWGRYGDGHDHAPLNEGTALPAVPSDLPDLPDLPGQGEQSDQPAQRADQRSQPEQSGQPGQPDQRVQPGQPDQRVQPGQRDYDDERLRPVPPEPPEGMGRIHRVEPPLENPATAADAHEVSGARTPEAGRTTGNSVVVPAAGNVSRETGISESDLVTDDAARESESLAAGEAAPVAAPIRDSPSALGADAGVSRETAGFAAANAAVRDDPTPAAASAAVSRETGSRLGEAAAEERLASWITATSEAEPQETSPQPLTRSADTATASSTPQQAPAAPPAAAPPVATARPDELLTGSAVTAAETAVEGAGGVAEAPPSSPAPSPAATAAAPTVPTGPWPPPPLRRVMAVANQKGGVGKTTSAVNVAAALALHGVRVLVVDLDPQGNASTAFDVPHQSGTPSIYDVLIGERSMAEVCVPVENVPNLWCAPATIDLAGAEIELVSVVARETRLKRALESVADLDYVFIDCPPSLGLLTLNAMVAASEVLIPIQCEFYALEGLTQLLNNVQLVKNHLNHDLSVSTILLTMYDARTRLADQVAMEVRSHFGPLVLDAVIPRSVRISEAPGFGQPVVTFDPTSRGALTYSAAAYDLARRGQDAGIAGSAQPSREDDQG